jgi:hypothetical protein
LKKLKLNTQQISEAIFSIFGLAVSRLFAHWRQPWRFRRIMAFQKKRGKRLTKNSQWCVDGHGMGHRQWQTTSMATDIDGRWRRADDRHALSS